MSACGTAPHALTKRARRPAASLALAVVAWLVTLVLGMFLPA